MWRHDGFNARIDDGAHFDIGTVDRQHQ